MKPILFLMVSVAFCQTEVANIPTLDLTQPPHPPRSPKTAGPRPSGSVLSGWMVSRPPHPLPFRVTIVRIDDPDLSIHDQIKYELEIENTGKEDLLFPRVPSVDWEDRIDGMSEPPRGVREASVCLVASITPPSRALVGCKEVEGAENVADSFRQMRPADKVHVLVSGRVRPELETQLNALVTRMPGKFLVRGWLDFLEGSPVPGTPPVDSANSAEIEIRP